MSLLLSQLAGVYQDSVTESGSAAEVCSAVLIQASNITEGASATDSQSATQVLVVAITEAASASDSSSAIQVVSTTQSEAVSAANIESAVKTQASDITEAASASSSSSASIVISGNPIVLKFESPNEQTYYIPDNVYEIAIECIGGGGAGNYYTEQIGIDAGGGGGGGGAYSKTNIIEVTPGQIVWIWVGSGGNSADGDDSFFSLTQGGAKLCLAKGGKFGAANSTLPGGDGGDSASGIGDIKHNGGKGFPSVDNVLDGGGGGSAGCESTDGIDATGASGAVSSGTYSGGGGDGGDYALNKPGKVGDSYGGGGGGQRFGLSITVNGGNGIVVLSFVRNLQNAFITEPVSGTDEQSAHEILLGVGVENAIAADTSDANGIFHAVAVEGTVASEIITALVGTIVEAAILQLESIVGNLILEDSEIMDSDFIASLIEQPEEPILLSKGAANIFYNSIFQNPNNYLKTSVIISNTEIGSGMELFSPEPNSSINKTLFLQSKITPYE